MKNFIDKYKELIWNKEENVKMKSLVEKVCNIVDCSHKNAMMLCPDHCMKSKLYLRLFLLYIVISCEH